MAVLCRPHLTVGTVVTEMGNKDNGSDNWILEWWRPSGHTQLLKARWVVDNHNGQKSQSNMCGRYVIVKKKNSLYSLEYSPPWVHPVRLYFSPKPSQTWKYDLS